MTSALLRARLAALRRALLDAPRTADGSGFSAVQERFLTLAEEPGFMGWGSQVHDRTVQAVVDRTVAEATGGLRPVGRLTLLHIAPPGFFHGGLVLPGWIGTAFWFEPDRAGLVSLWELGSEETLLIRLGLVDTVPGRVVQGGWMAPGVQ